MSGEHMEHIVLLGDSVFDNALYVPAGREVSVQLQQQLPVHQISLLARDGAVISDIQEQVALLATLSEPATRCVVSCGGNDVLGLLGAMHSPVSSMIEAAELLASWQAEFRAQYVRMLGMLLEQHLPTAVATIYDAVPGISAGLRATLAPFNDVILRAAAHWRLPVIDLRLACKVAGDYSSSSPIEPSAQGGGKIAAAIVEWIENEDSPSRTVLYGEAAGRG